MLTVGSLCSGYSGIELALCLAGWPVRLAWVADNDPGAARILAHRHPDVPNLGDIRHVQFSAVEPVDILTAGFPCTDISCAGRMAGMGIGTHSGVWAHVVEAIATLRPRIVLIENVAALLSTRANRTTDGTDGDVEPGPAGVGDGPARPALRALGAVLGDLACLGFDAEWCRVSAASIGAPHLRQRIFILAWPADTEGIGHRYPWPTGGQRVPAAAVGGAVRPDGVAALLPTPAATLGRGTGFPSPETAQDRMDRGTRCLDDAVALLPTPRTNDARGAGPHGDGGPDLRTAVSLLPTPRARDHKGRDPNPRGVDLNEALALLPTPKATDGTNGGPNQRGSSGDLMLPSAVMLLPTPVAGDADRVSLTYERGNPTLIGALLPTPNATDSGGSRQVPDRRTHDGPDHGPRLRDVAAALLPTPTATPYGNNQSASAGAAVRPSLDSLAASGDLLPTPTAVHWARNATADRAEPKPDTNTNGWTLADVAHADRWGQYAPAIARWEQVLGRPAPDPTEPGSKGQPRLSPRFVEWLMGLPDGWVTAVPGLSRNEQLRALGNGVVPQQGAAAIAYLYRLAIEGTPADA